MYVFQISQRCVTRKQKKLPNLIANQVKEKIYSDVFPHGNGFPKIRELATQFQAGWTLVHEFPREQEWLSLVVMKRSFGGIF